jgi:hypothetical protein
MRPWKRKEFNGNLQIKPGAPAKRANAVLNS